MHCEQKIVFTQLVVGPRMCDSGCERKIVSTQLVIGPRMHYSGCERKIVFTWLIVRPRMHYSGWISPIPNVFITFKNNDFACRNCNKDL